MEHRSDSADPVDIPKERKPKHAALFLYLGGLWVVAASNVEKLKPVFA